MLTINEVIKTVTKERIAPIAVPIEATCLVNINDESVMVIGGNTYDGGCVCLATVYCYNLRSKTWVDDLPELNVARKSAGGCFINGHAYVVAGFSEGKVISSIERLALP